MDRLQSVIDKQRSQIKKLDQNVLDVRTENDEVSRRMKIDNFSNFLSKIFLFAVKVSK